ncbi:hypothetical protein DL98DRAFT_662003 [Cadophora sp. DSE1049]|nr:hypothetical protein DL98DRAFT_662003 [Cadophora sp. DSE1049]
MASSAEEDPSKDMITLLRNEELTEAFDSLLPIYGLWDGMRLTTLHKIIPMRYPELIINYLERIKKFYSDLVEGNEHAMQKIDPATVKAIELRAPRASTRDAKFLYSEIHGGRIFSAFSDPEREEIWRRLQMFKGLVPSLYTFSRDILYLELLTNSVRQLTQVPKNKSLIEALQKQFTGMNQEDSLIRIQRTEDTDLGFASDEITALKQLGTDARRTYPRSRLILVTSGPGVALSVRYGKPRCRSSKADRNLLFIDHLHNTRQDQGDGITSFFVRKSVYLTFFSRPSRIESTTNINKDIEDADSALSYYRRQDRGQSQEPSGVNQAGGQWQPSSVQEERRQEQRRQEQELQRRLEQERLEQERLEWERLQQELQQEILDRERFSVSNDLI